MDQKGTLRLITGGGQKAQPVRRPIEEHDLLRMCDDTILKGTLTEDEKVTARATDTYKRLQRVFMVAYRMGEAHYRPRPKIQAQ